MNDLLKSLSALRDSTKADHMPDLVLIETADRLGQQPKLHSEIDRRWKGFQETAMYPHLQAAAQSIVNMAAEERLHALQHLMSFQSRYITEHMWIARAAAQQIAAFAEEAASVRCAFAWALHPALHIGMAAKTAGRSLDLTFASESADICDIAALCAAILEFDVTIDRGDPFARRDKKRCELEVSLPPFGQAFGDQKLSEKTLAWLGAGTTGRLSKEAIAIADVLAQAPEAHVVLGLSANALFRNVGVERVVRDELIASGRLSAVLGVPSGMIYSESGIATNLLILAPDRAAPSSVRFIDLAEDQYATKTNRGRYEAKTEVIWVDALRQSAEASGVGRDAPVSEIQAQGGILTVERYLRSGAAEKLTAFLERYETRALSEIVDLIRPAALPKTENGEFVVQETSPGDVGENGFVRKPEKKIAIDRGGLRKARNQQLEPGDLVLSVKGTIGKVGLVPDNIPDRNADMFWTVGQSMMILRPRRATVAPEVLYEYLSNDLVHEHLDTLAGGTVIQSLNIKDLKGLSIPIPSREEQRAIEQDFSRRQKAYDELERLRETIKSIRSECWPHATLQLEAS